ncbi:MAG: universal stress protein [Phycisphaerae bacterium]
MIKMAKILYPTDFSDLSMTALNYAKSFAQQFDAELHCIHVVDEAYQYWLLFGPDGATVAPNTQELFGLSQEQMNNFIKTNLSDVPKLKTKIITGKPFVEIIQYAREEQIDMIILATHGRSGLKHVLMGSVAERVVRKAPCPVLTIHSGEHEFVLP